MKTKSLLLVGLFFAHFVQATVWTVSFDSRPAQFTNLQTAIDAAAAGDTLLVNGYGNSSNSNVTLLKPLVIIGEKWDEPANQSDNNTTNPYPRTNVYGITLGRLNAYTAASGTRIYGLYISYLYLNPDFSGSQTGQVALDDVIVERCGIFSTSFNAYNSSPSYSNITFRNTLFTTYMNGLERYNGRTFSNILVTNCVFTNAYLSGSGSYGSLNGSVVVRNSIFIDRTSSAIFSGGIKGLIVENCIFYRSEPTGCVDCTFNNNISYLCLDNTLPPASGNNVGSGNIENANPQWTNYPALGDVQWSGTHNYSLQAGSAALGTGTNGTNIGLTGGNAPVNNLPITPKTPEVIEVDIPVSSVPAGGTLQINLKARTRD